LLVAGKTRQVSLTYNRHPSTFNSFLINFTATGGINSMAGLFRQGLPGRDASEKQPPAETSSAISRQAWQLNHRQPTTNH